MVRDVARVVVAIVPSVINITFRLKGDFFLLVIFIWFNIIQEVKIYETTY